MRELLPCNLFKFDLVLALLGLPCCTGFSLVAASRACSLVAVCGLPIAVASLVVEAQTLGHSGFSSCRTWAQKLHSQDLEHGLSGCSKGAQLLHSMWDPPP